ncbi:hypothetical protein EJD97_014759 [Solanum chilense]|uniref:Neprosin PEP catalytic domain-containing protein n=1 Tax=Solanum chilense TaxID=4083 RepID=A0A6N2CDP7_SOLCI|nr:hypothetical protein EJD97_014759 [Solanum chilense]
MLIHQGIIRQTLLVLYLLLNYDSVQGKTLLSKIEELELEEQFKLLNKPSVKTIKSKFGDIYDCVDFYKQPAFDHPLLKNHNFHPEAFPIRRITKEDLIRQRNMPPPEDVISDAELTTMNNKRESKRRYISSQGYKLAIVRTPYNPNNKFGGAGMSSSVYNPQVEGQQHSACRLKIQKESDIIQVGWRVDPTLYKDNKTRLFVHFQAGDKHCFNTLCPGFVQVSTDIPLDIVFNDTSQRGAGGSWEFPMYIKRDQANGNWWLILDEPSEQIGFWPQKIFTSLTGFANNIEWGGVAYSPPGVPKPPMGSSYFPIGNTGYDAYCGELAVLDHKCVIIDIERTIVRVDDPNLYRVIDGPRVGPGKLKHYVLYGGPGESNQVV